MSETEVMAQEQRLGSRGKLLLRSVQPRLRERLLTVLLAPDASGKMTYEEFLEWTDEDMHAEWVDGEVIMTSPASDAHQDAGDFLTTIMRIYIRYHGLGWVRSAPFQMKTGPSLPGRQPDIVALTAAHLDRLRPNFINGPADLAVEIISRESEERDRGDKFREYAEGGVAENWLIDLMQRWAEFYYLEDGRYHTMFAGSEGVFHSEVLRGFWLKVEWLWQKPKPSELDVLRELGVVG